MIKKFIYLLIPFFVAAITAIILNNFLDKNINSMLEKRHYHGQEKSITVYIRIKV